MTAESISASLVSNLSIMGKPLPAHGYYRSKLFIAPFTTNPLVAAAGPVLSLLERLCISPSLPPIADLRENVEHELLAFDSRLHGKAYSDELNAIAHYLLCATIDEILGKSYLRLYGVPAEFQAFTPLSHNGIGPEERFFDIVNHIKERPNQYLDLIELAYYCLITGFEGKQHCRTDGRQVLDNLIEELFQLIKQYRVNKPYRLFKEHKKPERSVNNNKPFIVVAIISLCILVAGYGLSYLLVENKAKMVQFGHTATAKLEN
ncbi:IcmH (DotU) [Legionella quinlivanii]|uniref:IcmH (DotU) n=1 Tax=Legionella quinlivanii TaxID=45073 RepID=A0A0W0XLJ0_9GAMM|nr:MULTISPECIES: type IVB secretion system protein IcmH/DotU [Legionella]KTD45447.1 IcmH (DotU) [Legionella quinlivanii]MCW8451265.1 type IVB secretion system protein IcmH/DotU [Legionella quinlivanii]SEG33443.1 type IV / VI secretion system protein, DotU family [Legionella quinlivanii DSM 21216]STY10538.1 IcmH (DotU) [Legionella quinlivanii]